MTVEGPAPPRSLLYVPASRRDLLAKVASVAADRVVVDLEDGVAPGEKERARQALREVDLGPPERWWLRIAAPSDIELARAIGARTIVIPKAERIDALAAAAEGLRLALMIETARGVVEAERLAAHPAVVALALGSADLRLSLSAPPSERRDWERASMAALLLAARAHGCAAIDSVYFHFRDDAGLRRHAAVAREMGFDGKSCIHPAQLEPIHEIFASTDEERAWAERVIEAWQRDDGATRGVVVVDGEMVEALHVVEARRLLAR